jgi:peptide methionine sulfoxide reductase MsrA
VAEPEHQDYLETTPGGYTCHFVRKMPSFLMQTRESTR